MIKITSKNNLFFIGKVDEVIEAIDNMLITYGENATLAEIIKHYLKAWYLLLLQPLMLKRRLHHHNNLFP